MIHLGDITKINGAEIEPVDCITGGSPCQDLSVAGKRAGLAGERSGLFMEQIRVIKEMRQHEKKCGRADEFIRPRWMVWENVPGAFSSNDGEDFRAVLEETARIVDETAVIPRPPKGKWASAGCIMGDGWSIAWRVHDAQFWGVPQRRKRIALVADFTGGAAPEVLFERKSMSRNPSPGTEPREETPRDIGESTPQTSKCLNGWDVQSKHIQPEHGIAEALYSGECRHGGGESYVMQTNKAISFQERAGKPGGGKGILIQNEKIGALSTLNNQSVCAEANGFPLGFRAENTKVYDEKSTTICNGTRPGFTCGVIQGIDAYNQTVTGNVSMSMTAKNTDAHHVPCVLEGNGSRPSHSGDGYSESEVMYTLNSTEHHAVCIGNGQMCNITMKPVANTLDTMHDQQAVLTINGGKVTPPLDANYYRGCGVRNGEEREVVCYAIDRASFNQGQNAQFGFSVQEDLAQTIVAKGPGGGIDKTIGALCARDYKGVGNQYVSEGKLILQDIGKSSG